MWVKSTDLSGNTYLVNISQFDSIRLEQLGDILLQYSAQGDYYRCGFLIFKNTEKAQRAFDLISEALSTHTPFLDLDKI